MAKAVATCTCKTCGKEFEVVKILRNRRDADDFERYAEEHYDECRDCWRARIKAANAKTAAEIIEKYGMPEITGVSEKQIAYAEDLRNEYIANCRNVETGHIIGRFEWLDAYLAQGDISSITDEEARENAVYFAEEVEDMAKEEFRGDVDAATEFVLGEYGADKLAKLLTVSEARAIIDIIS